MDNRISSAKTGEPVLASVTLPLIETVMTSRFNELTDKQYGNMASKIIEMDAVAQVFNTCAEFIKAVTDVFWEVVAPLHLPHRRGGAPLLENAKRLEFPHRVPKCHRVTDEDVKAGLGDSLHHCSGTAPGQEKSHLSEKLVELFATEVANRVNCLLATVRESVSLESAGSADCTTPGSQMQEMVITVSRTIQTLLSRQRSYCPGQSLNKSLDSSCASDPMGVMEFGAEQGATTSLGNDLGQHTVVDVEMLSLGDAEESSSVLSCGQDGQKAAERLAQYEKTFLGAFLRKLLVHIALSTKTPVFDVDFAGMLRRLRERTDEEIKSTPPQCAGEIHISVYKELYRAFGSERKLQAAMMSNDMAFEVALARSLKSQLEKSTREKCSSTSKVRRLFSRKKSSITPVCEAITSETFTEVISFNAATPPEKRRPQCRTIVKIFSPNSSKY